MAKGQRKVGQDKDSIVNELPIACCDETAAVEFMEKQRWGDHPRCPHCECQDVYQMKKRGSEERNERFLWRCRSCGKQYTVRIGTVFEDSAIPLRHWCYAFWKACSCKNGVAALEIKRQTGLSYKSALFMMHRIRYAMSGPSSGEMMEGYVESDETYIGGKPRNKIGRYGISRKQGPRRGSDHKTPVMVLIERGGEARAKVLQKVNTSTLRTEIRKNVSRKATLVTDEAMAYRAIGAEQPGGHLRVNHSGREYVRGDAYTNTAESFFAGLKRSIGGTYIHVSKRHLHRYVAQSEFMWNTRTISDGERIASVIRGAVGKRLMYREPTSLS